MLFDKLLRKKPVGLSTHDAEEPHHIPMAKVLTLKDLTFFGIAAIIGAGIFSSIGSACFSGGPAVILLFIICAIACGFTAMCYAEFASRVPLSGSAYTYAYVSFGELFAWIIGWALLMEYSIGNIYVAFSWSGYFTNLLEALHIHLAPWLTSNYTEAHAAFNGNISGEEMTAWTSAPMFGGLRIIFDLPAVAINIIITWLVIVGVKESKNVSNLMVMIKLAIIALVIFVGAFYVDIDNWKPFMPNGFLSHLDEHGQAVGVMAGIASVFFAFIGFDAVSTLAEECKNPQKDLPRGMIYSLLISTVIFVVLTLVLTGMVSYKSLNVSDPLAEIFALKGMKWMLYIVSVSAVVAMTSVILVFQMGQPRIWMTMSRDGLMPKRFASIHPKYKTPAFASIITGLVVGVPIFFTDRNFILDFTSIGTLFAFTLVCGGVLTLPARTDDSTGKFKMPYINAKWIVPLTILAAFGTIFIFERSFFTDIFNINADNAVKSIPMIAFLVICVIMSVLSFVKNFSLIPTLGFLSCIYLFTGFNVANWKYFFIWMLIGLVIYFCYGFRKSKLNTKSKV
ncbi:MAG: amino acid permease [Bacteroidia bacterium]